jgi:hypothetical protein
MLPKTALHLAAHASFEIEPFSREKSLRRVPLLAANSAIILAIPRGRRNLLAQSQPLRVRCNLCSENYVGAAMLDFVS